MKPALDTDRHALARYVAEAGVLDGRKGPQRAADFMVEIPTQEYRQLLQHAIENLRNRIERKVA